MSVFAERLKNLRDTKGQTQGEVGKAVGKSRESVSKYEIGEREPDTTALASIAKHFNVSADYILGITDDYTTLTRQNTDPYCFDILSHDEYLRDEEFVPYFKVAVKMKDNELDVNEVDPVIDRLIKTNRKKHP